MKQISQTEIATRIGVSRMAVNKWFAGKTTPTVENLVALANMHKTTCERMLAKLKKSSSK